MRKIVGALALALGTLAGPLGAQQNLFVGGGFEPGAPAAWFYDTSGCAVIFPNLCQYNFTAVNINNPVNDGGLPTAVHSGIGALEIEAAGTAPIGIAEYVNVVAGENYIFSAFVDGTGYLDIGMPNCSSVTGSGAWAQLSESCTATSTGIVTARVGLPGDPQLSDGGLWHGAIFDDASFIDTGVTVTPEPGSLALLATGLLTLIPMTRSSLKRRHNNLHHV